ncbi:MAG: sulfite exporter TauE/SafE family protein [Gemmataceae bacterium]|nr:sulfite exporter TauE/SafE family protein [Gemmataceae bacterium]
MSLMIAIGMAFWLGLLTSVSPCPLATNLAAVAYIGRGATNRRRTILSGVLYTAGRVTAYVGLASLLVASLLSSSGVSRWLQEYMNQFVGPLLVVVGMILVGLLDFGLTGIGLSDRMRGYVDRMGLLGAAVLGLIFALSFCPVSAALYFGSLIPIAVKSGSFFLVPIAYGVGTGIPVIGLALLLAGGTGRIGWAFQRVTAVEKILRRVTGIAIILIGIYLTLQHVWRLPFLSGGADQPGATVMTHRPIVLFVCVENSNRSQMAEAFARMIGGDSVEAHSAGSRPSGRVNPRAVSFMKEVGYDLTTHRSKSLEQFNGTHVTVAVTMGCGDFCPLVNADRREDWNIPDPKDLPDDEFRRIRDMIREKVKALLASVESAEIAK